MGGRHTDFEYSWKYDSTRGSPDVRYTIEPIGKFTGTLLDLFNQETTKELLYQLNLTMPSLDLTLFHHFATAFFDAEKDKYVTEAMAGAHLTTTMSLAFEFVKKCVAVKCYFAPKKLGQTGPMALDSWASAVRGLPPSNETLEMVVRFLETNPVGLICTPFMLAIDLVKHSESRVEFYVQTPHTNFNSVRTVMTMGSQIKEVDHALEELNSLIRHVGGVDSDFPSFPFQRSTLPLPKTTSSISPSSCRATRTTST